MSWVKEVLEGYLPPAVAFALNVACAIGRFMAEMVATERRLWLNISGIEDVFAPNPLASLVLP